MPRALITGIAGQIGSYLAELLLDKGYIVDGILKSSTTNPYSNIKHIKDELNLHYGDITDASFLSRIDFENIDEIYHLAAQSHVAESFKNPEYTWNVNYNGTLLLVNAIYSKNQNAKFYFAGTSEMFGNAQAPQNEETPFEPCSPYAQAKARAFLDLDTFINDGNV